MINHEVEQVLERYSQMGAIGKKSILQKIPEGERLYKCHTCHHIVNSNPCPNCGEKQVTIMCPLDHCHCGHDITSGIKYCPLCGDPICPECGCHDILAVSRVTGLGS